MANHPPPPTQPTQPIQPTQPPQPDIQIQPITTQTLTAQTFANLFDVAASAFGTQTHDAIFALFNPAWWTPAGAYAGAARLASRFRSAAVDSEGRPATIFLEATVSAPDPDLDLDLDLDLEQTAAKREKRRKVVGMAIWVQASFVEGYGERPIDDEGRGQGWEERARKLGLVELYPDEHNQHQDQDQDQDYANDGAAADADAAGSGSGSTTINRELRRYITQCEASLHADRVGVVRALAESFAATTKNQSREEAQERRGGAGEKQDTSSFPPSPPPAAFVLDMCAVSPEAQGKGVASALVRWGLDEAKRRGGLECLTEASMMGRGVYERLGFRKVKQIVYRVDEQWAGRDRPDNVFMRTGS